MECDYCKREINGSHGILDIGSGRYHGLPRGYDPQDNRPVPATCYDLAVASRQVQGLAYRVQPEDLEELRRIQSNNSH